MSHPTSRGGPTLDILESRSLPLLANIAVAVLLGGCVYGAWVRRDRRFLLLAGFMALILSFTAWSSLRKPRLLLRLTSDGFWLYRKWEVTHGIPVRNFSGPGQYFPWTAFREVQLETRIARFTENTKERVLRMTLSSGASIDKDWSVDADDKDFLVQASGQSVREADLLRLFEHGLRQGRLGPSDFASLR
jgi:hypothetical protein